MITGDNKNQIDSIWDSFWSGGFSNPLEGIEQGTFLLFIKRPDELHTLTERKAAHSGQPVENPMFRPDQDHVHWSRFNETAPQKMFASVLDEVLPFSNVMGKL